MLKQGTISEELSTEERIVNASLRCLESSQRAGVEALFMVFGTFAEDAVVPAAVLDALVPIICTRAAVTVGGTVRYERVYSQRSRRDDCAAVRSWRRHQR